MGRAPRLLTVLAAALLSGCAGVHVNGATVSDDELRRKGEWSERDAAARAALRLAGAPEELPVRLPAWYRRGLDEVELFGVTLLVPRTVLSAFSADDGGGLKTGGGILGLDLSWLFGLGFEPRLHVVPEANALILLQRERPPVVLPLDPDRPVGPAPDRSGEADAIHWFRAHLRADLEGVPPAPPAEP